MMVYRQAGIHHALRTNFLVLCQLTSLEVSDTSLDALWAGLVILCCVQCPSGASYKTCWMLKPKIVKLEVFFSKNSGQYKFNPQFLHILFVKYGIFGLKIELDIIVQKKVSRQYCAVQFS